MNRPGNLPSQPIAESDGFRLKAVAELLDGKHHFIIPSYQRGYRWDEKQVEDLLNDIWAFAKSGKEKFYCLQPIVVSPTEDGKWIVIDGQQRLTTMLLLLSYLRNRNPDDAKGTNYTLEYQTRPKLDFDNIDPMSDIDNYYVDKAKSVIRSWFASNTVQTSRISEVLFLDYRNDDDPGPQVKFIWYVVDAQCDNAEIGAIKIFNNLNRGKIGLTSVELIKALYVLEYNSKRADTQSLSLGEFSYQWNEIENELHDDRFWLFLNNEDYNPSSRIELIFDFLTGKSGKDDKDFSYRRFQELFDRKMENWKDIENPLQAWQRVVEVYHSFRYWYQEPTLYHLIGYLISIGVKMKDIFRELEGESKNELVKSLKLIIRAEVPEIQKIDEIGYDGNKKACSKILLLFNVITHMGSSYPFPFDRYKKEKWDIEHVDSQTEHNFKSNDEKIQWLSDIEHVWYSDKGWDDLLKRALELKTELEKDNSDGGRFKPLYDEILSVAQKNEEGDSAQPDKDSIGNLALLDAATNRSYGNALFPTKRARVIAADADGKFVPLCTKNLFLKYYSPKTRNSSQWDNKWNEQDKRNYSETIKTKICKAI